MTETKRRSLRRLTARKPSRLTQVPTLLQGPLPATAADFWRMVWEQGSGVLVMLTRLTEQVVKCAPYFPDTTGSSVTYGAP